MNDVFLDGFLKQANLLRKGLGVANSAAKKILSNPHAKKTLIGAGAGAIAGAGANVALGDKNESITSRALKGGAGGALVGGVGGFVASKIKKQPPSLGAPRSVIEGSPKPLPPTDALRFSLDGKNVNMKKVDGVYKAAFYLGFNKEAGIPGALGTMVAKIYKAPGQAVQAVKNLPETVRKGVDTVKATMARNKQEMLASHAREMGFKNRAARGTLDLSAKASKGRIMTGQMSPEAIRQSNGSLLSRVRNVATAGTLAAGTGVYMGMKDPEQDQRR